MAEAFTGKYWPAHVKPREEEIFSSWLQRLAAAHGVKVHVLARQIKPDAAVWNRDIDAHIDPDVLSFVANKTGVSRSAATATCLKSYEGRLFGRIALTDATPWILPLGIYHRRRRRPGLQYCVPCLRDYGYVRRSWRLACAFVCVEHRRWLRSVCEACGDPFMPYRRELGDLYSLDASLSISCSTCGHRMHAGAKARVAYVRCQIGLEKIITEGVCQIGVDAVPATEVFEGLRLIASACVFGPRARTTWAAVRRETGACALHPYPAASVRRFEDLDGETRGEILVAVQKLVTSWPDTFLRVAADSGMRASDWTRWSTKAPLWFVRALREV